MTVLTTVAIPKWVPYAISMLIGLILGWMLWHPRSAPLETAAPAVILKNGVTEAARVPATPVAIPIMDAVKEVKGAKLERSISITVQPKVTPPSAPQASTCVQDTVAPVQVDIGLVKLNDGTQRVLVNTNGTLLKSVDIPVIAMPIQRQLKWGLGVVYDATGKGYGLTAERVFGPFVAGVDITRNTALPQSFNVLARLTLRF